jgi:drug/metabolite transporter (DMT)-like permease
MSRRDNKDDIETALIQDDDQGPTERSSAFKLFWAGAMLFSGTFTTIFGKSLYETNGRGSEYCDMNDDDNKDCDFNKPWFTVFVMKFSMSLCLVLYYAFGWGKDNPNAPHPSWSTIKAVAFPASLDLLNTTLGNVGLLWVNSSIYQMTRGSVVIFSAILSVKYLGRTLRSFHYWSIVFVLVAVIVVGFAGVMSSSGDDDSSGGAVILGLGFILAAQLVTAVQFIAEESLMNNPKTTLDPVALVGFEGLWGLLYFTVLAPMLTLTPRSDLQVSTIWHEDFIDTFVQLSNSSALCWLCFGYFCTILMYNISANIVTQTLSAVVRSILEACRVIGVWVVGLLFYYTGKGAITTVGEEWSNWSYLELGGFIVLMYGTFAYKALIRLPWVDDEVYEAAKEDADAREEQHVRDSNKYQSVDRIGDDVEDF